MKFLLIVTTLLLATASASADPRMRFIARSCDQSFLGDRLEVAIVIGGDPTGRDDTATVTRVARAGEQALLGVVRISPILPDDPDASYTHYRGETGSLFDLRIYNRPFSLPTGPCNSVLSWAQIGGGLPVHMMLEPVAR